MRPTTQVLERSTTLRRSIERLEGLPLRAETVRATLLNSEAETPLPPSREPSPRLFELDPGWELRELQGRMSPLDAVAESRWWLRKEGRPVDALDRLWMQAVAVRCAAKRLAAESGANDPRRYARIGLLLNLGLWAIAAIDPEALAELLSIHDLPARRDAERRMIGVDSCTLGRKLAERWVGDPSLADACWLHSDRADVLSAASSDKADLALLQRAYSWAERTPWALNRRPDADGGNTDPRIRLLMAEVQMRCGGGLASSDASEHEERLARSHAKLLKRHEALQETHQAQARFVERYTSSEPSESVEDWADRAALSWCREPGVASARVVWNGHDESDAKAADLTPKLDESGVVIPLGKVGHPVAEVQLRLDADGPALNVALHPALAAWNRWASSIADRERLEKRLQDVVASCRTHLDQVEREVPSGRLEALAEFAAGAGHELNNPLAVIVGRAQLLLARANDPETVRSLRAMIGQARRAHRILRDLMYVARPPALRPRPCVPDDIVRSCLRDLQPEADARGLRLIGDLEDQAPSAWLDPDPLRHLIDVLARNALEATPAGGTIRISSRRESGQLVWVVRDSGKGIDPRDGRHLLDPFYCGRQAGRGLGLGLPRAARFVSLAGGRLQWESSAEQGTTFRITLPLPAEPPRGERAQAG